MKTILTLILTALLVACGSENEIETVEPNQSNTAVVAWADLSSSAEQKASLDLSREVAGCAWDVSLADLTITRESVTDGQVLLAFKYETTDGAFYSVTFGAVTHWLQIYEKQGFYRVGVSCIKT